MAEQHARQPKLDARFSGEITEAKSGRLVPEDEYVVFSAADTAFALTLPTYLATCEHLGSDAEQLGLVREMTERVVRWRSHNEDRCGIPNAHGDETLDDT